MVGLREAQREPGLEPCSLVVTSQLPVRLEPIAGSPSQPLGSTCFVAVSSSDSAFSHGQRSFLKFAGFMTSPVVKSLPSHCRGHEFDPWLGN